jgi:diguanylate cyclase (GGDEF)-like protein/PAS domain S-box-containing protein
MQTTHQSVNGFRTSGARVASLDQAPRPPQGRNDANCPSGEQFGDICFEDMALITLDAIGDGVLVVDTSGKLIYVNKVAEKMTGWPREEALGRLVEQIFFIFDGDTRERAVSPAQRAIDEGKIVELALGSVLIQRDGELLAIEDSAAPIRDRHGKIAGAVIVFHDANQSGAAIEKMSYHAQHDFLTGLPNRMLLLERLTHEIAMSKRRHKKIALLFLDLDRFKQINDTHGHAIGDHLLQNVAAELRDCVRNTDIVSRHSGDEFVVLLTEIEVIEDVTQVADKILARFSAPRTIDGLELQIALSIGIAVYPDSGTDADALIRNADKAMYTTKASGRNGYQFCPLAKAKLLMTHSS